MIKYMMMAFVIFVINCSITGNKTPKNPLPTPDSDPETPLNDSLSFDPPKSKPTQNKLKMIFREIISPAGEDVIFSLRRSRSSLSPYVKFLDGGQTIVVSIFGYGYTGELVYVYDDTNRGVYRTEYTRKGITYIRERGVMISNNSLYFPPWKTTYRWRNASNEQLHNEYFNRTNMNWQEIHNMYPIFVINDRGR